MHAKRTRRKCFENSPTKLGFLKNWEIDFHTKNMQIASSCKTSACNKCETPKKNSLSGVNQKIISSSNRSRSSTTKLHPPSKLRKQRRSSTSQSNNHHRFDHTYAANVNFSEEIKTIVIDDDDDDEDVDIISTPMTSEHRNEAEQSKTSFEACESEDIGLKSSWLRNLCLEYQPANKNNSHTNGLKPTKRVRREDDGLREKRTCLNINGTNGTLKQYQRNRKADKSKAELPSALFGRSKIYMEEKKRWIAALALIELAQSK